MFLPFLPLIGGIVGFAAGYAIAAAVEYLNGPKIKELQAKKKLGKAIACVAKKAGRVTFKDLDSGKCSDVECEKVGDDVQVGKKYYYN
ncbi:hypothetical protein [uncultured Ruminococcus sp.]|uniref:hypothetical protein n=1 Tax=Ruminococcus sp. TaxID=41978 RepID=UPI00266C793A|nr:hypothetical protein [uncultured Ruminococcus sp.]